MTNTLKLLRLFLLAVFCLPTYTLAQDSMDARTAATDRYFKAVPVERTMEDMFSEMANQMPQAQRLEFLTQTRFLVRLNFIERVMRESMIKSFTADEINALADFYGSKHGVSAMRKFGSYMSQVLPAIDEEMRRGEQLRDSQQPK